jgi:hypothetical protein
MRDFAQIGIPACRTIALVNPSDYAVEELALWERALQEQRAAEQQVHAMHMALPTPELVALAEHAHLLRTRADLLLAEAVRVKSHYRDQRDGFAELAGPEEGAEPGAGAWLWPRQRSGK